MSSYVATQAHGDVYTEREISKARGYVRLPHILISVKYPGLMTQPAAPAAREAEGSRLQAPLCLGYRGSPRPAWEG